MWLSAREKFIFQCSLHTIEDFILLIGTLHRVLLHDFVNINSHLSFIVDNLLQCVHKTAYNL